MNAFVARFVGDANVLAVAAVKPDRASYAADVAGVGRLTGRLANGVLADQVGAAVWRAEDCRAVLRTGGSAEGRATAGHNVMEGSVEEVAFEGRATEMSVRLGNGQVVRAESNGEAPTPGDRVGLIVDTENTLFVRAG